MQQNPRPSLRTARILAAALFGGPVVFFGMASFLIQEQGGGMLPPDSGFTPGLALWILLGVIAGCAVAAMTFRNRAVARVEQARGVTDPAEAGRALAELQTFLIITWALIEGPALFAGVLFLLFAAADFLWIGVAVLGVGLFVSFPRAEWFEPLERVRDGREPLFR